MVFQWKTTTHFLSKIRSASILYVDETSIHVQGEKHWIWTFTTPSETFYVIRKSRGMKVLMEVLTRKFTGIIVCDGWNSYVKFTKRLHSSMGRIRDPGISGNNLPLFPF